MKKQLLSLLFFLTLSFLLCGLQGTLYFLPFPRPYFWFIILTFYSFQKNLLFCLMANILHICVIGSYSAVSLSFLLLIMNFYSLFLILIRERFHTSKRHVIVASGSGCLFFLVAQWFFECFQVQFYSPPIWSWLFTSLMTFAISPLIVLLLDKVNTYIQFETVDTLENLRI